LTESASRKYFGEIDPIGETLTINLHDSTGYGALYKVTGVMADPPTSSHFTFTMIASFKTIEVANPNVLTTAGWGDTSFHTYLLLRDGVDLEVFSEKINDLYERKISSFNAPSEKIYSFKLQPLQDIYLHSHLQNEIAATGNINQVYLFSSIGIFILLLASINYVNLAIASLVRRAKEVGIKKVIGARKGHLIIQYLCETVLITLLALLISFLLCTLLQPVFMDLTGKSVHLFSSPFLLFFVVGVSILLGIVSGLYPAIILSGFSPMRVLKGNYQQSSSGRILRKSLVVVQFTATIVFVTGIIVVNSQMRFIKHKSLGFNKDGLIFFRIHGNTDVIDGYKAFKNELLSSPLINSVTTSNALPLGLGLEDFETEGPEGKLIQMNMASLRTDSDYMNVFEIELIAGRNFQPGIIRDTIQPVILNEAAVQASGWESAQTAIGKSIKVEGQYGEVIGVIKNFHFNSLHDRLGPLVIYPVSQRFSRMTLKADVSDVTATTEWIEQVWRRHFPSAIIDYSFFDGQLEEQYRAEEQFGKVLTYSSIMSLLIACLGLYGLVLHAASQKLKEIGIRKVLGASVNGIVLMLSKDFLKLVMISIFIAIPIGWYIMSNWLENFAYRTTIAGWMFLAASLIVIVIAMVTVSLEAIKASLTNPVDSLRSE
jgi:putative ABC transport system permease protein